MSEKTGIAWTDHTFNPWWGCVRVSPGCENCYAERDSKRYGFNLWGPTTDRRFFGDKHWNEPRKWDREAMAKLGRPARVFCASMADVFEDRRDLDEPRARLFRLVEETPNLHWQLLTKRPENARALVPAEWNRRGWPPNAWFLFTAEDQAHFDKRWPEAAGIDAVVKGVSYEPALGAITFGRPLRDPRGIDWVIVGGESGPASGDHRARPFDVAWAQAAIAECKSAGVAVFTKQLGDHVITNGITSPGDHWPRETGMVDTGLGHWRKHLVKRGGSDPSEWPESFRVREFPL